MKVLIPFTLDVKKTNVQKIIHANKGEGLDRKLQITLVNGSEPLILDNENQSVQFIANKPDGTTIYNSTAIKDGKVIIYLTTQTVAAVGDVDCQLEVVSTDEGSVGSGVIYSAKFTIAVEEALYNTETIESSNEFTELIELIERAEKQVTVFSGEGAPNTDPETYDEIKVSDFYYDETNARFYYASNVSTTITWKRIYNKDEVDAMLDLKADKSTTYTKTEVDAKTNKVWSAILSSGVIVNTISSYEGIKTNDLLVNEDKVYRVNYISGSTFQYTRMDNVKVISGTPETSSSGHQIYFVNDIVISSNGNIYLCTAAELESTTYTYTWTNLTTQNIKVWTGTSAPGNRINIGTTYTGIKEGDIYLYYVDEVKFIPCLVLIIDYDYGWFMAEEASQIKLKTTNPPASTSANNYITIPDGTIWVNMNTNRAYLKTGITGEEPTGLYHWQDLTGNKVWFGDDNPDDDTALGKLTIGTDYVGISKGDIYVREYYGDTRTNEYLVINTDSTYAYLKKFSHCYFSTNAAPTKPIDNVATANLNWKDWESIFEEGTVYIHKHSTPGGYVNSFQILTKVKRTDHQGHTTVEYTWDSLAYLPAAEFSTFYNDEYSVDIQALENGKQDKLIPGANITIGSDGKTISASASTRFEVVETLPVSDIRTDTIYLVPKEEPETGDYFDEYAYINNEWELIGTTQIDLSNYQTLLSASNKLNADYIQDGTTNKVSEWNKTKPVLYVDSTHSTPTDDLTDYSGAKEGDVLLCGSYFYYCRIVTSETDYIEWVRLAWNSELSNYQTLIDSSHKLSADLISNGTNNQVVPISSSTESGKYLKVKSDGTLEWATGGSTDLYSELKIVCMGDSLTEGDYGSDPPGTENVQDKNYPYFLGRYLNSNNIVNLGKCGLSASSYWTNYIQNHASDLYRADAVVILLGMNYFLTDTVETDTNYSDYHDYANTTTGNYCKIIEWTMEQTNDFTQICLVTLPYVDTSMRATADITATNTVIKKIGAKYSIPVFDLYNEGGYSKFNLDFNSPIDGLHFGYYGYQRLATYIGSKIKGQLTYLPERHQTQPITYSLVHTTSSNTDTTATNTYSTHLTIDEGYSLTGVTVYMGGLDVTDEVYDSASHNITINDVRGAIVIQAIASEGDPYTEVDAIITGGHHAINTGKMMIPNAKFEIEFQPTETQTTSVYIAGAFVGWNTNRMSIQGIGILDFSSGVSYPAVLTPTGVGTNNRNIKFSNDGIYYDDVKYNNVTANNMTGTLPIYLGAVNYGGTLTAGSKVKLKKWKWYDGDGNLVQDLIPVLDENGEPCMYDRVTQGFFYNIGSGQFGYELNGNIVQPT